MIEPTGDTLLRALLRSTPLDAALLVAALLVATPFLGGPAAALAAQAEDGQSGRAPARDRNAPPPAADEWNDDAVLELVRRARAERTSAAVDPDFTSYRAHARGHVYFFVERPDSGRHVLVKGDQVALDLYWRAPDRTQQWIVGQRDEKVLPTSIRYHLDHLTVVMDDFGDFIRLGDGDEVEQVVHPVGPQGELVYDYRLADSLRLSYAAGQEEVRVYEIQVRPRDLDGAGYVGTVFVDRDRAAIVRMNFSFTPSSYVDPYLDYIRISLDNSLWMGRHWLPFRQEVEIRREVPFLDFMAGSTIRTIFDIRGYDFNLEIPDPLLAGRGVRSVSPAERRAFPFERGIFAELDGSEEIGPSPKMEEVRTQVRAVVEDEVLSGLAPLRLHAARLSDFARYNRAEGIFTGAGLTLKPHADVAVRATAGYAFGRDRASGTLTVTRAGMGPVPTVDAYWDAMGDIGGHPGATPLENTIGSASGSKDYLDPYFRRGGAISLELRPDGRVSLELIVEEHRSATDVVSDGPDTDFRPVRSVDEGTMAALSAGVRLGLPAGGSGTLTLTGGRLADIEFGSATLGAQWTIDPSSDRWSGLVRADAGVVNTGAPAQTFYLIGGRHTLPGHDYRSFAGRAYGLLRAEGTLPLYPPYLGLRAFAAVAATHLGDAGLPADWPAVDSDGLRGSVGLGLSFGWDSMRLDVGRAVRGGGWEAVFSVAPRFRSWL